MANTTPVKIGLISVIIHVKSPCVFNNGCNFMKLVAWCFVPRVLPYGSDSLVDGRFKSEVRVRQGCMSVLRALCAALPARS